MRDTKEHAASEQHFEECQVNRRANPAKRGSQARHAKITFSGMGPRIFTDGCGLARYGKGQSSTSQRDAPAIFLEPIRQMDASITQAFLPVRWAGSQPATIG